jgi:hypothetical protein
MRSEDSFIAIIIIIYGFILLFSIATLILLTIARWKLFEKAGIEGWKAIIPYYNMYVLTVDLAGKDILTFVLHFIPFINIYAAIVTNIAVAKSFGKDVGYGIGLTFLGIVFYPMLAFSKDTKYIGPDGENKKEDSTNSLTNSWQNNDPNVPPTV